MKTKTLRLQDSTIAYLDEGKGKPIVLLHGFCGSSRYWEKIVPKLAENYRVIAPDLPGHGQSSTIAGNDSIEGLAAYVKNFLDQLNIPQVTLFGHSLGGYITLAFAEKYSDCLNGYSLVHSTAFPDSEEAKKGRDSNVEKVKHEGIPSLIDGLVPNLFSPDNLEKMAEDVEIAKQIGYSTTLQGAISALVAMKDRPDRNSVLQESKLPVLLIAGEKDQVVSPEKTFSVSKENIKQSLIRNSGHMSMYENPQALINEIEGFLTSKVQ